MTNPIRVALTTIAAALAFAAPAVASNGQMPVSAAMAQCSALDGPTAVAQANFADCVRAKSGKTPPRQAGKPGITISGSARIGIVYED
ncbi:MAG: hypothetical protein AAF631_02845 [Pseudomonadota bacterium]